MIRLTKVLAFAASLMVLSSGTYVVLASQATDTDGNDAKKIGTLQTLTSSSEDLGLIPKKNVDDAGNNQIAKPSQAGDKDIALRFDFSSSKLPLDIKHLLMKYIIKAKYEGNEGKFENPLHLATVCKEWNSAVSANKVIIGSPCWKWLHGVTTPLYEVMYQQFINGSLLCRPNPDSDEGMVEIKLAELARSLTGEIDLSQWDAGKYVSINIGLRPDINLAHESKPEIFIIPWFLANRFCDRRNGAYLKRIMNEWDGNVAPFGIFFHWWGDVNECYVYCIWASVEEMSKNNLSVFRANGKGWMHGLVYVQPLSCFVFKLA